MFELDLCGLVISSWIAFFLCVHLSVLAEACNIFCCIWMARRRLKTVILDTYSNNVLENWLYQQENELVDALCSGGWVSAFWCGRKSNLRYSFCHQCHRLHRDCHRPESVYGIFYFQPHHYCVEPNKCERSLL